jgi:TatD DNase family protein
MFVDSHAHLTGHAVLDHVEEMLERAGQRQVKAVVNICTDLASLEKGFALVKRHRWVFNAAAVHPHDVEKMGETFFPEVARYAREGGLIAIGETGLDYHYEHSPKDLQREHLARHVELALETKLPLIFHCRDAFHDLFEVTRGKAVAAVLHCFTGTMEEAQECLERGWMISFSGIVTFKNSVLLREVAKYVPLDRLLIETDTPFLAPLSKRGKMNEPGYVVETAEVIAGVRGMSVDELGAATSFNAAQFFCFPKHIIHV